MCCYASLSAKDIELYDKLHELAIKHPEMTKAELLAILMEDD